MWLAAWTAGVFALAEPASIASADTHPRGDGMIIAGGVVGGLTLLGRLPVSVIGIRRLTCSERTEDEDACEDADLVGTLTLLGANAFAAGSAVSLGLLGAGLFRRGRWASDTDAAFGRPLRRFGVGHEIAGWSLLGAGVGLWVGSAVGAWVGCSNDGCIGYTQELGFYGGAVLVGAGIGLAPYARGYRRATSTRGAARISAAPIATSSSLGLAVSGRF